MCYIHASMWPTSLRLLLSTLYVNISTKNWILNFFILFYLNSHCDYVLDTAVLECNILLKQNLTLVQFMLLTQALCFIACVGKLLRTYFLTYNTILGEPCPLLTRYLILNSFWFNLVRPQISQLQGENIRLVVGFLILNSSSLC